LRHRPRARSLLQLGPRMEPPQRAAPYDKGRKVYCANSEKPEVSSPGG